MCIVQKAMGSNEPIEPTITRALHIRQGRRKHLKSGCAVYYNKPFLGGNFGLYLKKEPKSGYAAAHPAHPVPATLLQI